MTRRKHARRALQRRTQKWWLAALASACLYGGAAAANSADTLAANIGFHLLEEPVNPRSIGMGSAGTGLAGSGFAYYNPALPFLFGTSYASVDYGQYPQGDLQRGNIEAAWVLRQWFAGASFATFSINDIVYADERGMSSVTGSWRTSLLSLAAGFSTKKGLALALCLNGAREGMGDQIAYALSFSGGAAYTAVPGKLSLGAAGFHAGASTGMLDETRRWGHGARLPLSARAGVAWTDTLKSLAYTVAADVMFRNVNKQIMLPVGVEVRPLAALALRAGKRLGHGTELFNLGVGLRATPLEADMSFVIPRLASDTELKWQAGLTFTFVPHQAAPPASAPAPLTAHETAPAAAQPPVPAIVLPIDSAANAPANAAPPTPLSLAKDTTAATSAPFADDSTASAAGDTPLVPTHQAPPRSIVETPQPAVVPSDSAMDIQ